MTLEQLRKRIARYPHSPGPRRDLHYAALGRLAKFDVELAIEFAHVLREACIRASCGRDDLLGWHKGKRITLARDAVFVWLRDRGLSYPMAADLLGARSHSSALLAVRRHQKRAAGLPTDSRKWAEEAT